MKRRIRAAWRLARIVVHVLHGVAITLWSFRGMDRAQRQAKVRWWAGKMLRVSGVAFERHGEPARGGCLLIANHVSWLDIVAVHAVCPQARFVSKADVKRWPVLNRLVDAAGTVYLEREKRRDAMRVVHHIGEALQAGDLVAVFPEGTTGTGRELLPFHANLLQAAIATAAPVQPLALRYGDAQAAISDAVVYVGDTSLLESLWLVACADGLRVSLRFLEPQASAGEDRRALGERLRQSIGQALDARR
ncbi:MAG TPA: lysophospholipid acyltransferase family protein [Methylibium sp.]|uniref:lysophospholipid acyltransferase family protein n=1 Tax=Methylibium sp. TaxID=2067992 RepID=UPI002DBFE51C|nr:lysophospholipid acyltransferase family protein [Methylibium sp.]HEU4460695.1 lysophospholipid acyltransferase family protein [Methylibium sp.]